MARFLAISLHDGGSVTMRTMLPERTAAFDGLGKLLCLNLGNGGPEPADVELVAPDAMPEGRHVLRDAALTEVAYAADWSRILIAGWKKPSRRPHSYDCYVWQTALICACMNAALRGENAVLIHGAVLETDHGAVLLFGESGMGKSTAFDRWRMCGGNGSSDDMALLDFSGADGVVRVRRMPTWSACREGRNEWDYPAGEELPLAGVFALGRSESGRDEIADLSPAQFFAQCYRSMFYWSLTCARPLPDTLKERLTARIRHQTEIIAERFVPRALKTALDGDLRKVVEDSL